jgi:hypothetical protein
MINVQHLLKDLKILLRKLEDDIRQRCDETKSLNQALLTEHDNAVNAKRTANTFMTWRDEQITQASVAWILSCVFIRFIEDNDLLDNVLLSGPGDRLSRARDSYEMYFKDHPIHSDREYLIYIFNKVSEFQGLKEIFDKKHNILWRIQPSSDGAFMLIEFFRKRNSDTGDLIHDFTDTSLDTRFLGDLYQDLSEAARKKYALLQTPDFIEEFILDRTLTPAIETFGLENVRLIDPTCGSGHFLLGAFFRLFNLWIDRYPGGNDREQVQKALNAVYGVDLNPFAVAIAKFRLMFSSLKLCGIHKLKDAPAFQYNLAVGDSLLHGPRPDHRRQQYFEGLNPIAFVYEVEDDDKLNHILGQQYHAVVGNPPYITVKDKAINAAYREVFPESCYRQYSLVCPFMQRFFDLALNTSNSHSAGFIGLIAANSFMKREFGKKLVESCMPKWNLTHVIDTSGVYIPGHGTPTVILFGRNQEPVNDKIRAVMGIKGEPATPENAEKGKVWTSIIDLIDQVGSENKFVSVDNIDNKRFYTHPWSLGGGGAENLKYSLDTLCKIKLNNIISTVGFTAITGEDDVYLYNDSLNLKRLSIEYRIPLIIGDKVRDWNIAPYNIAIWPYNDDYLLYSIKELTNTNKVLWPFMTTLSNRKLFGVRVITRGLSWYEWRELYINKLETSLTITFAFVATHNHFILDRGGKIFNRSAPVIKLKENATIEDHLKLIGLLNSSTALFWARQTLFSKRGDPVGRWGEFVEWDGTKLKQFPIPEKNPLELAKKLDQLATQNNANVPLEFIKKELPSKQGLKNAQKKFNEILAQMISLQEELDWQCYNFYNITDQKLWLPDHNTVPSIQLGERAFELVMAQKIKAGERDTTWFDRHHSTPVFEIPAHWPEDYQKLVKTRIEIINKEKNIRLIEQPEYKRRWAMETWEKQVKEALEQWLLNRLEYHLSGRDLMAESEQELPTKAPQLISCAQLADMVSIDKDFLQVAELYQNRPDFNCLSLVKALIEKASVPFLPVLRYKPSGLRKRKDWEKTWELQRKEDAIRSRTALAKDHKDYLNSIQADDCVKQTIGDIPVPPKYQTRDFIKSSYWKLRGKLDVPKERFISYPKCERDNDNTLIITWAGWDHLQQAQALAEYIEHTKESGASEKKIVMLLAGLLELIPWLKQWHNDIDPQFGLRMGDYYSDFVLEEARSIGKTIDDLKAVE